MGMYASKVVELANSWVGLKESDGSFKKIIDIYNSIVTAMGEYATNGKTDWLLVGSASGLTGWCSSKWLEKL